MKNILEIEDIKALEVLDSRGNPTVQVEALLEDGSYDFESLDAIDTNLFNKDLKDLLEGKEVITPTYNFILGKREYINEIKYKRRRSVDLNLQSF